MLFFGWAREREGACDCERLPYSQRPIAATEDRTQAGAEQLGPPKEAAEDDDFLEQMFYDYADNPEDEGCVFAYWTDGIVIRRQRVRGKWEYRCGD